MAPPPAASPPPGRPGTRRFVKGLIAAGVLGVFALLFLRSVRGTRSQPYTVAAADLRGWTLAFAAASGPNDPYLVLQGSPNVENTLFKQLFKRAMESMNAPAVVGIPLLTKGEFDHSLAARLSPEEVLAAAQKAGLESEPVTPHCMAYRRASEPTGTQQLYFLIFDSPAHQRFRAAMAAAATGGFDPAALSPTMFVAGAATSFTRWLPMRADPKADCVAPIDVATTAP